VCYIGYGIFSGDSNASGKKDNAAVADKKDEKVIKTSSGLGYVELKEGAGDAAKKGDTVSVHYSGWLKDGTPFDSSAGKDPLSFKIGAPGIIQGWQEGIQGMKVGGKRKLLVPADLAYGKQGHPAGIPPDADLTFEVELVKIK
jgi:FKBP-type peptidyl-prolyl cis-trans isomerase